MRFQNCRHARIGAVLAACCVLSASVARDIKAATVENLAPKATVSASSEYDGRYLAKFAVDGNIPDAECKQDERQAWCIHRQKVGDQGTFTLEWPAAIDVAEVVYFGRTGQVLAECFKDYEVYADDAKTPIAKGAFKMVHGPQRIKIAKTKARKLTLKFLNSHGPYNPGASEIAVYATSPSDKQLGKFLPPPSKLKEKLIDGDFGFKKLLVIKRKPLRLSHVYVYHAEGFSPGGGLCIYEPGRDGDELREIVASPEGMIIDCDLSYNGREVVFSWKRGGGQMLRPNRMLEEVDRTNSDNNYQIWRCNVDGSNLTQLTFGRHNNLNACWLPDGGIAFLSDRKPAYAYCFVTTSPVLYRMDRDGKNQKRLSSNYLMDFTPSVLNDGRIIYTRWEYVDKAACPIQSLWSINPDGTGLSGYYGNRVLAPGTFMEAQPIPGTDEILCLATNHKARAAAGSASSTAAAGPTPKRPSAT